MNELKITIFKISKDNWRRFGIFTIDFEQIPWMHVSVKYIEPCPILNGIRSLNTAKSVQESNIPTKITKENELSADVLHVTFNECLESRDLASLLKWADVTPIFKKVRRTKIIIIITIIIITDP